MKTKNVAIATIDHRHPFTRALHFAIRSGKITPEKEGELQEELVETVTEATQRFIGFQTVTSITKGLDFVLGVLSLAVVDVTKGREDLGVWSETVTRKGVKTLVNDAVSMIKALCNLPDIAQFEHWDKLDTVGGLLRDYATSRSELKTDVWNGYGEYAQNNQSRMEQLRYKNLGICLIQILTHLNQKAWLETSKEWYGIVPLVETTINTLLFRHCAGLSTQGNIIMRSADFKKIYENFENGSERWIEGARMRYDELVTRIPEELHPALGDNRDWFERHLAKGPKPPKRKKGQKDMGAENLYISRKEQF